MTMNPTLPPQPPRSRWGTLLVLRTYRMYRPLGRVVNTARKVSSPPKAIGVSGVIIGFAALIVVGAVLLSLPAARHSGTPLDLMTSFFTVTSAVCLTGLVVVDTGDYWTTFGQAVILGLVQLGALGVMTASMLILMILRRPISFRDRFEVRETSKSGRVRSVGSLVLIIILVTAFLELVGTAALWGHLGAGDEAWWPSAFHAVSAFNNAGFDITRGATSLTEFARDPILLLIIAALVIAGGLGVLVLMDLVSKRSWRGLSITTKVVLISSVFLLALGLVGVLGAEFNNAGTLGPLSLADKLSNGFFHSVVSRTAGFNTLSIADFQDESLFLTMALMFIGGATGSTAGGIKLTTFAVLCMATWAAARGYDQTSAFGRRLSHRLVYRAVAIAALTILVIFIAIVILSVSERFVFRELLFEATSALGTVGLSTGITPELSIVGKLTVMVLMFVGRLGPLTLAYALARRAREPRYQLPEGDLAIG